MRRESSLAVIGHCRAARTQSQPSPVGTGTVTRAAHTRRPRLSESADGGVFGHLTQGAPGRIRTCAHGSGGRLSPGQRSRSRPCTWRIRRGESTNGPRFSENLGVGSDRGPPAAADWCDGRTGALAYAPRPASLTSAVDVRAFQVAACSTGRTQHPETRGPHLSPSSGSLQAVQDADRAFL